MELQRRGLKELDRKRLKTEGEALGFIFFFFLTPSRLSLAVTLLAPTRAACSRRPATTSDRHNLRCALKGPSRRRNVSQAAMAPFNFNYKFPLVDFASICCEAQRLVSTVGNTLSFLFVLNIRRYVFGCVGGNRDVCTWLHECHYTYMRFVILVCNSLHEGMNLELLSVSTFCNHFWRCLLAKE